MITFDLKALLQVKRSLGDALIGLNTFAASAAPFTTVPSINTAFAQHQTIWAGQSGSGVDTIENIRERIQWVHHLFAAHISGFELQEELSKASLDSVHSHVTRNASEHQLQLPSNAERQIDNLIYNVPIAAGEATTPLAALIAAFQGDDSVPLLAAKRWSDAGRQLGTAMASLNNASNMIAASAQGTSFDAARAAIGDLVKLGTVVSANTMAMAASVGQFPTIRSTNLAALHSIQASTALITSPAERLAAEQAAVASFVSSHLQPSLELVKPPVSNLGVPITIRSGGGTLSAGAFGDSSAPAVINTINGTTESAAPTATGTMAHHASHAAAQAGHGSPSQVVATPASAATSPVSTPPSPPHLTPATGAPVAAHAPSAGAPLHLVSPAPTANAQVAFVRPATAGPAPAPESAQPVSRTVSNVTPLSAPRATPLAGGATGIVRGVSGPSPLGSSGAIAAGGTNPTAGRAAGSPRVPRLPYAAQTVGQSNVVRGAFGAAPVGSGTQSSAGARGAMGVGGRGTATKASAKVFNFSKSDREYFARQFMGRQQKRRTVRKVITGK
ncbi:hypothetical protein ACEN19_02200 [Corynebacterium auriscanis]|uniref:hypothetical protein n=1 Tax=Corynebacterium auriscanis TaxID=99807 RepID=UPI003CE8B9F5